MIGFLLPFLVLGTVMLFLDVHGVLRGASVPYDSLIRMQRAYSLLHWKPERIIFGTSTVGGIDANHPALKEFGPTVEMHLNGAKTYEVYRYVQHATAASDPDFIILGIDFLHMSLRDGVIDGFAEHRFLTDSDGNIHSPLRFFLNTLPDVYASLYATQSLELAMRIAAALPNDTLRRRAGYMQTALRPDGHLIPNTKLSHYVKCRPQEGVHRRNMENFAKIIATLRKHNVRGYLFITPYHAYMIENLFTSACKDQYEGMLRDITNIIANDAAEHGEPAAAELWDFSMPGSLTTDVIVPHDNNSFQLEHYLDLTHYYSTIGDRIIDRMFDYDNPQHPVPADFGTRLTSENIDAYLQKFERQVDWYRALRHARGEFRPGESDSDGIE